MNDPVIIDGIAAAVLVGFVILGAYRGLIRTVAGLLVVAVALVGASVFANLAAPAAGRLLRPAIERQVERRIDEALEEVHKPEGTPEDGTLDGILSLLGLDGDVTERMGEKAEALVRDEGVDMVSAVVQAAAESVLHAVLLLVSFFVLLIGLKLLVRTLDLIAKLPGVHQLNAAGGAAVGLAEGMLALFLAVWVLRRFGVSFDTAAVERTVLVKFFAANTPLSVLAMMAG